MTEMMWLERVSLWEREMSKRMENKEKSKKKKEKKGKRIKFGFGWYIGYGVSTQSVLSLRWVYAAGTRATTVIK